ncbi:hypothetical protein KC929_01625 [Patescibacteria group bacterium]|nr:hypothetical protein [Patescibacteria group bacterium]
MKKRQVITHSKLKIGDLLLLIPQKPYRKYRLREMELPILWSHAAVEYKVFGRLRVNLVLDLYLRKNPHVCKRRKIISLEDPSVYPEMLEEILFNSRDGKCVALGYKYFSELQEKMPAENYFVDPLRHGGDMTFFVILRDSTYFAYPEDSEQIAICSFCIGKNIEKNEKQLCSFLKCSPKETSLPFEVDKEINFEQLFPKPFFEDAIKLRKLYLSYLFNKDKIYSSLISCCVEISWEVYVHLFTEIRSLKRIAIGIQGRVEGSIFEYYLGRVYGLSANNIIPLHTQIISFLYRVIGPGMKTNMDLLKERYPRINKVIIEIAGPYLKKYVIFKGIDENWKVVWKRKRKIEYNSLEGWITNEKRIMSRLFPKNTVTKKPSS